jgi:hypothetical protein
MTNSTSLEELAMNERKFLHDIANHIVVAQGMLSFVQKNAVADKPLDEKDIERLEKAYIAVTKMTALMKERRAALHAINDKTI